MPYLIKKDLLGEKKIPLTDFTGGWTILKRAFLLGVILLSFFGTMGAGSMQTNKDEIQLTGRIYIMGNEPFTQVAIQLDGGKIYILMGKHDKELRRLQGKRVTVQGKLGGETPPGVEKIEVKSFRVVESK